MRARVRVCVTALGALLVVGCGSGSKSDGGETVAKYISRVTTQDGLTEGQLMAADAPDASGGPDLQVMAGMRVPNGGSLQAALTASAPARMVFVHVMEVPGHYALQLPADASSVNLLVTMAQKPPSKRFSIGYAVADASGKVGNTKFAEAELLDVGTGDVQVSLNMGWAKEYLGSRGLGCTSSTRTGSRSTTRTRRRRKAGRSTSTATEAATSTARTTRTSRGPPAPRLTAPTPCGSTTSRTAATVR